MLKRKIGDIFCPHVIGVSPDVAVSDAIRIMRDRQISCIIILEDRKPAGIFTERDIVRSIATKGINFTEYDIRELMSCQLFTSTLETFIYEAFNLLVTNNIRHLVVVDDQNHALGVVTQSDMIEHLGYEYFVKVREVSHVMNSSVFTIPKDSTVYLASTEMANKSASFLIVTQGNRPVGVLSERDITRLVAENCDIQHTKVEAVMSSPVVRVTSSIPIYEAASLMKQNNIRRLVVVDQNDRAVGVTTQTDIVKGLESKYIDTLKQIIIEQGAELDKTIRELSEKTLYLDNILSSSVKMGIVTTDAACNIIYYNSAAEQILGRRARDVIGCDIRDIHDEKNIGLLRFNQAVKTILENQNEGYDFSFESGGKENKRFIHARISGIWDKAHIAGFVLLLQDITDKKKAEETIRHLAYYDILTGLPNRVLFSERISTELLRSKRHSQLLALMVLDIDKFKEVNDTMGHHAGDALLKSVADRMKTLLRKTDTVARIGGDEFTFIFPEIRTADDAALIAGKILKTLDAPFEIDGRSLPIGFSIGIALSSVNGEDVETLMKHADYAMYRAKEQGRRMGCSNFCFFSEFREKPGFFPS